MRRALDLTPAAMQPPPLFCRRRGSETPPSGRGGEIPLRGLTSALPAVLLLIAIVGCSSSVRYAAGPGTGPQPRTGNERVREGFTGTASYYGPGFHGKQTANGERFDMHAMTAAHKTLPFNTRLRVTNTDNGKSVIVRINDRGPYKRGRVLDLSKGAAQALGMLTSGTARVRCEVLE